MPREVEQYNDYLKDLEIDHHRLETEWLSQPSLMMKYSMSLAQAQFDLNRAKEDVDVTRARLDNECRRIHAEQEAKISENGITAWINRHETYQEKIKKVHEIDLQVGVLKGAIAAFSARKTALENLVKLFLAKYYAEPYTPEGSGLVEAGMRTGKEEMDKALGGLRSEELPQPREPLKRPLPLPRKG